MSTTRHPQTTDGLAARVNKKMQILLRYCYTPKSGFDWVSHLPMVIVFYYNCSINEASKHYPFEVSYGFQPATHANNCYHYLVHRLMLPIA
jgi:hypothetical protein